ncbi:MAG TPA: D-alanyl-D-alanine carboxypeptidase/D-alanyl-D-alanine-endopeptidase [Pyrinomonadaceae bacterium]|nr:D-alanyl-D-alanine carboxypeptidase/D-alanyl-D-alanine-endopeptidase [Pyrinomonadaceae bacterium]
MAKQKITKLALLKVVLPTLFLASLLIARSGFESKEKAKGPAATPAASAPLKPSAAKQPDDAALSQEIDRAIDGSDLTRARWGVFVISTKDGRVLYSRNGDSLFTPASNMKVYTTAVALDMLGADYRWRTSVYVDKQPDADGIIAGDVTLYGRGAPDLMSVRQGSGASLAQFADQLYQSGVRHVRGNVIGDESYFRSELFGLGWQWNDLQWYFGAEPSALTIDENSFELTIAPGSKPGSAASVAVSRDAGFVHLTNITMTGEREATNTVGINRGLSNNELRVWGDFPVGGRSYSAFLSVHNPALWAATLFKQALVARGIKVDGEVRSRDFRLPEKEKFDPQKAFEIASQDSATLAEIVRKTNKESNNLFAELILRTLGKERGASAPDPDARKNRERGDDEAGTAVVRSWLARNGISDDGLAIRDGSGLSRLDLVTPEATARLLVAIGKTNSATTFHDSLPIAGRDGTLGSRLQRGAGRISAKTGTISYVHSLSGYAAAENGEILCFSIFCNDSTVRNNPVRLIDEIAGLLISYPRSPAKK